MMILRITVPTDEGLSVHYANLLVGDTWELTDKTGRLLRVSVLTEGQTVTEINRSK